MTYPGSRFEREETRAECDAWDEAYWQDQAAQWGDKCLNLAQELVEATDRYPGQWSADDDGKIKELHATLTRALEMARGIGS